LRCARGCQAVLIGERHDSGLPEGVRVKTLAEEKPINAFNVQLLTSPIRVEPGREYTLSFRAKGTDTWKYMGHTFDKVPSLLSIQLSQRGDVSVLLDSEWRQYHVSLITGAKAHQVRLRLGVGEQVAETHVSDVKLRRGGAERWQRDFEHGKVLLNMTKRRWKVKVGDEYRYLRGKQDPEVNTGKPTGEVIEIPPDDARLLVRQ